MPDSSPRPGPGSTGSAAGPGPVPAGDGDLLLVVVLGMLWGAAFPVIRAGIIAGAPPLLFAALRYLLTSAALAPIALFVRSPRPSRADLLTSLSFGGLLMIAGYGGLLYLGETSISGGLAAVLTASAPLASALIGYRLLPAERFGRFGVVGLLVGFVGVTVLVLPGLTAPRAGGLVGSALVFAAVLTFATGSVLLRRTATSATTFWLLSGQFALAGAVLGGIAILVGEPLRLGTPTTVLSAIAFLVVLPGIIGYSLYFRILYSSGPTRANLVGYVNPVTGVLVGLLVFGEAVTSFELGGLALIALGLYLLQRDRHRPKRAPPAGAKPSQDPAQTGSKAGQG